MIGTEQDLMLNLMQIADEPDAPPEPSASNDNPLSRLKPYPYHKGSCMGMVCVQPGCDEDENPLMKFVCAKCGKEEIMPMEISGTEAKVKSPEWVAPPNA